MSVASTSVISVSTSSTMRVPMCPSPPATMSRSLMNSPTTPPAGKAPSASANTWASSAEKATRHRASPDSRSENDSWCSSSRERVNSMPPHRPSTATSR